MSIRIYIFSFPGDSNVYPELRTTASKQFLNMVLTFNYFNTGLFMILNNRGIHDDTFEGGGSTFLEQSAV